VGDVTLLSLLGKVLAHVAARNSERQEWASCAVSGSGGETRMPGTTLVYLVLGYTWFIAL